MKCTKKLVLLPLIAVTSLFASLNPNTVHAFPFSDGNNNSGSSACYHNGSFYGMAWGGASCPEIPINDIDHIRFDDDGNTLATFKHDPIDCVIVETPFKD